MTDLRHIADRYIASWNEPDAITRRDLIASLWTHDAHYSDPMMQADGQDGINELIGGVQAKFPGYHFALTGTPDGHGTCLRFSWSLSPADGSVVARGTDFAALAPDGRLRHVTGFLDQVPAAT